MLRLSHQCMVSKRLFTRQQWLYNVSFIWSISSPYSVITPQERKNWYYTVPLFPSTALDFHWFQIEKSPSCGPWPGCSQLCPEGPVQKHRKSLNVLSCGDSPRSWTITGLEFCVGSTAPLPKICLQVRLLKSQLGIMSTIVTQVRVTLKSWMHVMMRHQFDEDKKYTIWHNCTTAIHRVDL